MCVCVFWTLSFSPILYFVLNCFFFAIWNLSSSSTSYRLLLSVSICMRKISSHSSSSSSYCCCFCSPLFYLFIDDWHRHKTMHTLSLLSSIFFIALAFTLRLLCEFPVSTYIRVCGVVYGIFYAEKNVEEWHESKERTQTNKSNLLLFPFRSFHFRRNPLRILIVTACVSRSKQNIHFARMIEEIPIFKLFIPRRVDKFSGEIWEFSKKWFSIDSSHFSAHWNGAAREKGGTSVRKPFLFRTF